MPEKISELLEADVSVTCCTLEAHGRPSAPEDDRHPIDEDLPGATSSA